METQKTILIVEDEVMIAKAYAEVLEEGGFNVLLAQNGKDGLKLALSKHPDLILLDLVMPEMDGMTALKEIRQDTWGVHVPVIILTNLSATDEKLVEGVAMYRPLHYLVKSDWKLRDVVGEIKKALKTL